MNAKSLLIPLIAARVIAVIVLAVVTTALSSAAPKSPTGSSQNEYEVVEIDGAQSTFTAKLGPNIRTFRVRQFVDISINGQKARFEELEPGMKVKVIAAADGIASQITATGLRSTRPAGGGKAKVAGQPAMGLAKQSTEEIAADKMDAFVIPEVRKGTKISLQYVKGKWKSHGRVASNSPDDPDKAKVPDDDRLVIALPSANGNSGEILGIIPSDTAKKPFVFEAGKDYPGLVLRIHGDKKFSGNPGKVEYLVKVIPPR